MEHSSLIENIYRLLKSKSSDDVMLGLELLRNLTDNQIIDFFIKYNNKYKSDTTFSKYVIDFNTYLEKKEKNVYKKIDDHYLVNNIQAVFLDDYERFKNTTERDKTYEYREDIQIIKK